MSSWVTKPLGELIALQRGHDLPSQNRNEGVVPIMGSSGVTGFHNEIKTPGPGVVVGRSGNSMGEVSFCSVDFWPLNTCLYVTDFKGNDERYIYYLLQTINFDQFNSGSAQKSLNRNAVYPYEVTTTECKDEQIRIGRMLAGLEDKIELNRQINQTLEHIAQAIFKSWFVDFEPTRAKIAAKEEWAKRSLTAKDGGNDENAGAIFVERAAMAAISGLSITDAAGDLQGSTNTQSTRSAHGADSVAGAGSAGATSPLDGLDQLSPEQQEQLKTTAALFPDSLVDSELGEIPEGWSIESIYDIADVIYGAPFKSKLFNEDEGLPLVRIRDLKHERPGVCTPEVHKKGYLIQNGDLLVGMDGEFRPYIWGGNEAWMNQRICTFKPKKGLSSALVREFITRQLRFFELTAVATTVIHLGKGDIDGFTYIEPNNDLLSACSNVLDPIFKRIVANKVECITLEETRDALLPKLLSGELSSASPLPLEAIA